jgi:hypothetical protein
MASKGSVSSFLEDLISFHLGAISFESDEREASLELYNEAVEEFVTDMVAGKGEVPFAGGRPFIFVSRGKSFLPSGKISVKDDKNSLMV